MMRAVALSLILSILGGTAHAWSREPVRIVAAENFYGDIAQQIGGDAAQVASILSNPDQDPHLFEADVATAKRLSRAEIVISNGIGYDPWMNKLLSAAKTPDRRVIVVGDLAGRKPGDNPHLWYDLEAIKGFALDFSKVLSEVDPPHRAAIARRADAFIASLKPVEQKIHAMRARFTGETVTATEPVFNAMAQAIGLTMRNKRFQLAIQNDVEPRISDLAAFERDLKDRKVKALIYNRQANAPMTQKLLALAKQAGIPIVGVTETEPAGATYQQWMMGELDELEAALSSAPRP